MKYIVIKKVDAKSITDALRKERDVKAEAVWKETEKPPKDYSPAIRFNVNGFMHEEEVAKKNENTL